MIKLRTTLILVTAALCFYTLSIVLNGILLIAPLDSMVSPAVYVDFVRKSVDSCAFTALVGLVSLPFIWIPSIQKKGKVSVYFLLGIISIPYALVGVFALRRYFEFRQYAGVIATGSSVENTENTMNLMALTSGSGCLVILFCLTCFALFRINSVTFAASELEG